MSGQPAQRLQIQRFGLVQAPCPMRDHRLVQSRGSGKQRAIVRHGASPKKPAHYAIRPAGSEAGAAVPGFNLYSFARTPAEMMRPMGLETKGL
jgi:hypothetical protein